MDHSANQPPPTPLTPSLATPTCACNSAVKLLDANEKLRLAAEIGQGLLRKNEGFEKKIKQLQAQLHDHSPMRMELDDIKYETDRLRQQLKDADSQLELVEGQYRKLLVDHEEQSEKMKAFGLAMSEIERWKQQATVFESEVGSLQRLLAETDDKRSDAGIRYKRVVAKVMELTTANQQLKQENQALQTAQERLFGSNSEYGSRRSEHSNGNSSSNNISTSNAVTSRSNEEFEYITTQCRTLMELVKELTMVNQKLKQDLAESEDMVAKTRAEVSKATSCHQLSGKHHHPNSTSDDEICRPALACPVNDVTVSSTAHPTVNHSTVADSNTVNNLPSILEDKERESDNTLQLSHTVTESALQTYVKALTSFANQLHGRIKSADPIQLNRRLRRAFDMREITALSNSIIDSILGDVQRLSLRFPQSVSDGEDDEDVVVLQGLLGLIQSLLDNVAGSRTTLNEYALSYVERMEDVSKKASAPNTSIIVRERSPSSSPSSSSFILPSLFAAFMTPAKPSQKPSPPSHYSPKLGAARKFSTSVNDISGFGDLRSLVGDCTNEHPPSSLSPITFWTKSDSSSRS